MESFRGDRHQDPLPGSPCPSGGSVQIPRELNPLQSAGMFGLLHSKEDCMMKLHLLSESAGIRVWPQAQQRGLHDEPASTLASMTYPPCCSRTPNRCSFKCIPRLSMLGSHTIEFRLGLDC